MQTQIPSRLGQRIPLLGHQLHCIPLELVRIRSPFPRHLGHPLSRRAYTLLGAPTIPGEVHITIDVIFSPIRDSEGRVVQIIGSAVDITERLRLEQDAGKHREQLAHVTRLGTMGEMATGLAHEINQPLAGISTYASACLILLRSADAFPESGKLIEILDKIDVQSRRAGDIIHGLRKLVRKRESVNVPFSMNQAVASALALTESEA